MGQSYNKKYEIDNFIKVIVIFINLFAATNYIKVDKNPS